MTIATFSRISLLAGASGLALLAAPALAADAAADAASNEIRNADDIVVVATNVNLATPITASVHTFEPQAIVSRSIIEDSVPATADFNDIALLTPGASYTDNGGGAGLSESKLVLRGFADGQYNVTYDGIPFNDSNDPTHHSTSYFPAGTYERIIIDRGPGDAMNLGQATYGGNVHMVSRELSNRRFFETQLDYGTWQTLLARATYNSGAIESLGGLKIITVGEYKQSNTALTGSDVWFVNGFIKAEKDLGDHAKFSILSTYNQNLYHQSDNNGVSCYLTDATGNKQPAVTGTGAANGNNGNGCDAGSQVGTYGKSYGLVESSGLAGLFANTPWTAARKDWNWTNKTTDFELARLQWNITPSLTLDNKTYTYFYKNFTFSAEDTTTPCTGTFSAVSCGGMKTTTSTGAKVAGDIPGYTKLNQYRTSGDVLQLTWVNGLGDLKVGGWYEHSTSHRYRYDYDVTLAFQAGALSDGHFDFGQMANFYNYKETDAAYNVTTSGAPVPLYIKYDEYTSWDQLQGNAEFEFKLLDNRLTITPGVKVIDFKREINTPIAAQSTRVGIVASDEYKPVLPYLSINHMLKPDLSAYAQFAKGFLLPSLGNSLETVIPGTTTATACAPGVTCNIQPTKTTNWQAGFVYAGNKLNIDADVYYIKASNSTAIDPSSGVATQSANPATYQGVEGQVSYVLVKGFTVIANGALMSSKDAVKQLWLSQAPNFVATLGGVYHTDKFKLSYLHKFTGRQFADTGELVRIAPYSLGILATAYKVGPAWLGVSVNNLWNDTSTTKIGSPTKAVPLYFFQSPRSVMADIKFRF